MIIPREDLGVTMGRSGVMGMHDGSRWEAGVVLVSPGW